MKKVKINWDDIWTDIIKYGCIGICALGLHLIIENGIEGHETQSVQITEMRADVNVLKKHHDEEVLKDELDEPSGGTKFWNWITFKEFRRQDLTPSSLEFVQHLF